MDKKPRTTLRAQVGPFAMVPVWVLERVHDSRAIHLYALLGKYANRERRAWPKNEQLAFSMDTSLRSVERAISVLRVAGAIQTEKRRRADGAVIGLDFILVQLDPTQIEQPATGDGLLNEEQPATDGGQASTHSATGGGEAFPVLPATDGGLSAPQTATGVAPSPPPVAAISTEELDPVQPDPKEKDLSTASTDAPPKRTLLDEYHDAFVARFPTTKPLINGAKDGKLLKTLADQFGEDRVRTLLAWFFQIRDPFIEHSGYTVGVFYACWNKLQLTYRPADPDPLLEKHAALLAEARAKGEKKQAELEEAARAALVAATVAQREVLKRRVLKDFNHSYPNLRERMGDEPFARAVKTAMVRELVDEARRRQLAPAAALDRLAMEAAA